MFFGKLVFLFLNKFFVTLVILPLFFFKYQNDSARSKVGNQHLEDALQFLEDKEEEVKMVRMICKNSVILTSKLIK